MIEVITTMVTPQMWLWITWGILFMAGIIVNLVYVIKYRNVKKTVKWKNNVIAMIEDSRDKLRLEFKLRLDEVSNERNEFYEGQIRGLNERIKKATDDNRVLSLHYAVKVFDATSGIGTETDHNKIIATAKAFHRHLQGKE